MEINELSDSTKFLTFFLIFLLDYQNNFTYICKQIKDKQKTKAK